MGNIKIIRPIIVNEFVDGGYCYLTISGAQINENDSLGIENEVEFYIKLAVEDVAVFKENFDENLNGEFKHLYDFNSFQSSCILKFEWISKFYHKKGGVE